MKKIVIILFVIMFTIISTNIVFAASVREDTIDGEFNGWEGETVVKLMSGQIWIQTEYYYWYHYAFMPKVFLVCDSPSATICLMQVQGVDKYVQVEKVR